MWFSVEGFLVFVKLMSGVIIGMVLMLWRVVEMLLFYLLLCGMSIC